METNERQKEVESAKRTLPLRFLALTIAVSIGLLLKSFINDTYINGWLVGWFSYMAYIATNSIITLLVKRK